MENTDTQVTSAEDQLREKIRAELEAEYSKKADQRVTNALKKRGKDLEDQRSMEQIEADEQKKLEAEKNEQELKAKDRDITEKELKLAVVDALEKLNLPVELRGCVIVSDLANMQDPEKRSQILTERIKSLNDMFNQSVDKRVGEEKKQFLKGTTPVTSNAKPMSEYDRAKMAGDVSGMIGAKLFGGDDWD